MRIPRTGHYVNARCVLDLSRDCDCPAVADEPAIADSQRGWVTFVAVPPVLVGVALGARYLPARRSSSTSAFNDTRALNVLYGIATKPPRGRIMSAGPTILLVEDNPDHREALSILMESWGYAVTKAKDGAEALVALRHAAPPSLVLLDLMLPWVSGWELLVELNKSDAACSIPVITISGLPSPHLQGIPGIIAHLKKPLDPDVLRKVLTRHYN